MNKCDECEVSIPENSEFTLVQKGNAPDKTLCSICAVEAENKHQNLSEDIKVFRAILFGFAAAAVCAILWYGAVVITEYNLGIVVVAIGWLTAHAVILGSGGKRGLVLQVISALAIILAMGVGQYLIIRHYIVAEYVKVGLTESPLFIAPELMLQLLGQYIKEEPQILAFWAIALIEGVVIPQKKVLNLLRPGQPANA